MTSTVPTSNGSTSSVELPVEERHSNGDAMPSIPDKINVAQSATNRGALDVRNWDKVKNRSPLPSTMPSVLATKGRRHSNKYKRRHSYLCHDNASLQPSFDSRRDLLVVRKGSLPASRSSLIIS